MADEIGPIDRVTNILKWIFSTSLEFISKEITTNTGRIDAFAVLLVLVVGSFLSFFQPWIDFEVANYKFEVGGYGPVLGTGLFAFWVSLKIIPPEKK